MKVILPPDTLKVAMNELAALRTDLNVALTGLDIEAKAELVERAFWAAAPVAKDQIDSVTTRLVRTDKVDPESNEEAIALWRVTLKDRDQNKIGRPFANVINELAWPTIPGMFAVAGSSVASPLASTGRRWLLRCCATKSGDRWVGDVRRLDVPRHQRSRARHRRREQAWYDRQDRLPSAQSDDDAVNGADTNRPHRRRPIRRQRRQREPRGLCPLGGTLDWLADFLTVERIKTMLPETAALKVERFTYQISGR